MSRFKLSKILFCIFVFLLPLQTRLILFPQKPEYSGFSVYFSEIFLWLAILFWLPGNAKKAKIPFVFFLFYIFGLLSYFLAPDKIAAFRVWLYFLEGGLAFSYLQNQKEIRPAAIWSFLISLAAVAIFGIWQFSNLGSPAFKWLGLAARGAWNLGDIVVESGGARWLRAYGLFPHPNIFGGYLAAGILMIIFLVSSRPKRSEVEGSHRLINGVKFLGSAGAPLEMAILYFFSGVFLFTLFLTFSRSAWLALAAAIIYFLAKNFKKETIKFFIFLLALTISFYIIFLPLVKTRVESRGALEQNSNIERIAGWRDGFTVWKQNPFFGSGVGNNIYIKKSPIIAAGAYFNRYAAWINEIKQPEPPHNIFILALTQLGIFGLIIYLALWRNLWKNKSLRAILILFFIIGMLDHYLWTLWPGQILFWLGLAVQQDV